MSTEIVKTKPLNEVLIMTNTSDLNLVTERNGRIYRTPFKGEIQVTNIEKNDLILFQNVNDDNSSKVASITYLDMIRPIIDPDNYHIYTERINPDLEYSIIPLEQGAIDPEDGDWLDYDYTNPYTRGSIYVPIYPNTDYKFECPSGKILKIRVFLCDSNKRIIHDKWFNGITNYQELSLSQIFNTVNPSAAYLMFDVKGNSSTDIEIRINTKLEPAKESVIFNKLRYLDDYETVVTDSLLGKSSQYEISHNTSKSSESILAIRSPQSSPLKSTLRLLNAGVKTSQFIDLSSVRDNEDKDTRGRFEIGIRSFESDTPVPDFVVGFADTINGDLIHKLTIDHDALPIRFTKSGVQFRINAYSNNTPSDNEVITINFKDLKDRIDYMYDSMSAYGILSNTIGEYNNTISASKIAYDNTSLPTVDKALDYIIETINGSTAVSTMSLDDATIMTIDALNINMSILENTHKNDMEELKTTVNEYSDRITSAENKSNEAIKATENTSVKISELEMQIASLRAELESVKSEYISLKNSLNT